MEKLRSKITIAQMAGLYGVTFRTLRFYEDRGLLKPQREGTDRFYAPKDRVRLELILKGKRLGFSLSEIEALILSQQSTIENDSPATDAVLTLESDTIVSQIAFLQRQRDSLTDAIQELQDALAKDPADLKSA